MRFLNDVSVAGLSRRSRGWDQPFQAGGKCVFPFFEKGDAVNAKPIQRGLHVFNEEWRMEARIRKKLGWTGGDLAGIR